MPGFKATSLGCTCKCGAGFSLSKEHGEAGDKVLQPGEAVDTMFQRGEAADTMFQRGGEAADMLFQSGEAGEKVFQPGMRLPGEPGAFARNTAPAI